MYSSVLVYPEPWNSCCSSSCAARKWMKTLCRRLYSHFRVEEEVTGVERWAAFHSEYEFYFSTFHTVFNPYSCVLHGLSSKKDQTPQSTVRTDNLTDNTHAIYSSALLPFTAGAPLYAGGGQWGGIQEPYFPKAISPPMAYQHSLFSGFNYCLIRLSAERGRERQRERARGGRGVAKSRTQEYTGRKMGKKILSFREWARRQRKRWKRWDVWVVWRRHL